MKVQYGPQLPLRNSSIDYMCAEVAEESWKGTSGYALRRTPSSEHTANSLHPSISATYQGGCVLGLSA
eukprot:5194013-Amphidinium_carterae.1